MEALSRALERVQARADFLRSVLSDVSGGQYPPEPLAGFLDALSPLLGRANSELARACSCSLGVLQYGRSPRLVHAGITATFLEYIIDPQDFEIEDEEIGAGCYSVVFLARRRADGRLCALKRTKIRRHQLADYEPFYRELEILTAMHHEAVLPVLGFATQPAFMTVTPFMPLGSLEDAIARGLELSDAERLKLALGVAVAMRYLHSHKVVHRDLKPENVFLNEAREPVVGDFGLSKLLGPGVSGLDPLGSSRAIGTPLYSAPEILTEDRYTKLSDVYSYGMTLYRVLCHERPFAAITRLLELRDAVAAGMRPDLPDDLPAPYRELIAQCWHPTPAERPSFAAIVERLKNDAFPGAMSDDFAVYRDRITDHAMTGRVLQYDVLNLSVTPETASVGLEISDSGPQVAMDSDWVDEDVELELPMAPDFLSSRAMVPGGYSAPGSPTPRLSSRKILVPSVNPIAFAVKKTPSTPTGPRPPITDLVKSSAPELAVKMRADKGDRDAQVMWAQHLKKNKQFEEAAVYWKMAADAGADRGQYYYGDALKRGLGVPVDLAEAARYFKSAADSGMKEAMFEYGILRRKVDEVEGDKYIQSAYNRRYKLALRWYGVQERRKGNDSRAFNCFRLAAEQGDAESQFFVGELLRDGRGTPKNPQEAERYFRQAVAKGHSGAAFALALLTRVSRPDESKMLLEKAARCKHGGAIFYLGRQKLAEGFEEEGNALIFEAAVRGHPDAMAMYAIAELDRQNDSPEILQFLESAAKHGSPDATIRLAERMMGENEQQAMDLIKHVASRDHPRAHYLYGIALLRRGAETDGKTHLRKAIELGDIDAIWALAAASFFIDPEEQHFFSIVKEHREALRQAADQGNGYAIYWLSKLTDDKDIGITLLKDAAERGVPQAQCDYAVLIQETNHAEADALFRSALEKHSAVAQLWFARINLTQGNKQKGISFLRRACQQGNIEAQFEFGKRIFGPTSRPEFEEALSFLRKAACTGHLPAMFFLGKYLLSIHDDSGHSYMREALARGYSETAPDADGSPT